jgi:hypothetical protein
MIFKTLITISLHVRYLLPRSTSAVTRWQLVSEILELVGLSEVQFLLNGGPTQAGRPMTGLTPPLRRKVNLPNSITSIVH